MAAKNQETNVYGEVFMTEPVVVSFVNLAEKDKGQRYSTNKYGLTMLVPKSDKATMRAMINACYEVGGVDDLDDLIKYPMIDKNGEPKDGDAPAFEGYDGYAGTRPIQVTSGRRPEVYTAIDKNGKVLSEPTLITDLDELSVAIYSGSICQCVLTPHLYKPGEVTFYLTAVMKIADGRRLGNSFNTKQIFMKSTALSKIMGTQAAAPKTGGASKFEEQEDLDEQEVTEAQPTRAVAARAKASKAPSNVLNTANISEEEDAEEEEQAPVVVKAKAKQGRSKISSLLAD